MAWADSRELRWVGPLITAPPLDPSSQLLLLLLQVSCSWGFTTTGGAKGVGESTTSAVVISLVSIFVADFFLSFLFFQGQGDALKQLK
jgi:hypothetical protein